ncbi:ribosomal RNA small subunit methyltransferase A [Acutalibacter muris]|uniref:Ribosomal RNA small subunit methyltransferase A n=1 Tax=Acutalibacter muris TaxID=1796620 RepID=A0A1Z2XVB9_9FIRM|nr:16S rRNA (adenine(1518)-N(6)/adenine(1519)-N(6))-dimethyltransferase RsmA [Acutalibacter muris]ANU54394.1 16S rRNA (adenine(1518)-N(6)/adenine(1519)-N(6))-dimethyltransferase [Hungateiclostridiaceae bacterium KB18]ASB42383.1 16S rRNA (adenine(1518)-N(6)/adenine(1519)-N(6))-dimethyltransferase [Acutalibacter muris]QQR31668.1 ribosomal RNA small subunit methyltransferase A [Acutalibacter muris]
MPPSLSDPRALRELLQRHGLRLSKGLGQNFLINPSVCPRMAAACGAEGCAGVLEVGPGVGVLTRELSSTAKKVVSVELDHRLLPILEETLSDCTNVEIVQGDILKLDLHRLIEEKLSGGPVCVCANLPYYITSPVIMALLEGGLPLTAVTVMVQKEAAARLCAPPGVRECGAVSVSVHYRSRPQVLFQVGRGSFMPPPNVDSSVIRFDMLPEPPVRVRNEDILFKVARGAFAQRRKTAANSLSGALRLPKGLIEGRLAQAGIPINARAEQLTLAQFGTLSDALCDDIYGG